MNKKHLVKYLLFVFISAYILEIIASIFAIKNPGGFGKTIFQVMLMALMFTPFFGTLFAKGNLKGIGFMPKFKGVAYLIPLCWFGPAIVASLGGAIFYIIFPDMFDLTGSYIQSQLPEGVNILDELAKAGINYKMYIVIAIIQSVTYAPLINMLLALGEEVGWRGFLYPELNKSMGKIPTWLLGGFIWGAFHFPVMILAGYEYGTSYFGFPVVGMIVFCIFCIALGLISEIIYDKTKCIWYPSLLHGAVNACSFTALFLNVSDVERLGKLQILGPFFNGVISGIPLLVIAIVFAAIALKKNKAKTEA